jgi:hypothetical protein
MTGINYSNDPTTLKLRTLKLVSSAWRLTGKLSGQEH